MMSIRAFVSTIVFACAAAACGSNFPQPTERLASTEAAIRSARELGADKDPQAALHVKLADEQLQTAKGLIKNEDNQRADLVLQRAGADAELALMMAKERAAKAEAQKAQENLHSQQSSSPATPAAK